MTLGDLGKFLLIEAILNVIKRDHMLKNANRFGDKLKKA